MKIDTEWIRINENFDANGERQLPMSARQVRSDGGMIIGRVVHDGKSFDAQVYRKGQFESIAKPFGSFEEAAFAMRQRLFSRR